MSTNCSCKPKCRNESRSPFGVIESKALAQSRAKQLWKVVNQLMALDWAKGSGVL